MKAIVDGLAVEYSDERQGPVILMLHGWGDFHRSFEALAERLQGYRVVRLDLPGFGGTELPPKTWDVRDYAHLVSHFCKKLGIEPEYMIGHSFGGRILIKALSDKILAPRKVVFVASAGVADRRTVRNKTFMHLAKLMKFLLKPFPRVWYERLRKVLYATIGGDYISAGVLSETFLRVINEDLSDDATRISTPALLIWGQDDLVTPLHEGKKLHRLIAQSEFHVLPVAGHFVHQQRPDEVADLIKKFLI